MLTSLSLKSKAQEMGFDLCGITSAEEAPHADYFEQWLHEEKQGEMAWLARDPQRRKSPTAVVPGAQSIITVGINYYQESPPSRGRVARYALGKDYHALFEKKLALFCDWLRGEGSEAHRFYVDTGPLLEKTLAQRSGLGWQGKSTILLNRHFGPWLFLGEILTTLRLPFDEAAKDHCGSCTRCITACPTGAITAPYQLDARRCISYLTIELKGSIPVEMRSLIGNHLYGCDDCLEVCPWNRFAQKARETHFTTMENWDLHELLRLDDEGFKARFRESPVLRLKRRGLARNACVVLGNIGRENDLSILREALADKEELVREHAAWAIEQIEKRKKAGEK